MQFKSGNVTLINVLVTHMHQTKLTQNPVSLFHIMCFVNCIAMIDPTVASILLWYSEVPTNEKRLFISCVLYQQ